MTSGRVTVRPATQPDLDMIVALERAIPAAPHWPREAYQAMLAQDPEEARIRCLLVAVAGRDSSHGMHAEERLLGFVAAVAFRQRGAGKGLPAELESVAVLEQARGRGLGRALCRAALDWASRNGAPAMELEVRAGNSVAVGLYLALGFHEAGRRHGYYRDPQDDALLMSADLQRDEGPV